MTRNIDITIVTCKETVYNQIVGTQLFLFWVGHTAWSDQDIAIHA